MLKGVEQISIGYNQTKKEYFFVVETYFKDFRKAFDTLEKILFP